MRHEVIDGEFVEEGIYDIAIGRITIIPDGRFQVVEESATEEPDPTFDIEPEVQSKESFVAKVLKKVRAKK